MFSQIRKKHRKLDGIVEYDIEKVIIHRDRYVGKNIRVVRQVFNNLSKVKVLKDNYEKGVRTHSNNYYTYTSIGQSVLKYLDYRCYNFDAVLDREHLITKLKNKQYDEIFKNFFLVIKISDISISSYYNHNSCVFSFNGVRQINIKKPHLKIQNTQDPNILFKPCGEGLLNIFNKELDKNLILNTKYIKLIYALYYQIGDDTIYYLTNIKYDKNDDRYDFNSHTITILNKNSEVVNVIVDNSVRENEENDVIIQNKMKLKNQYEINISKQDIDKVFKYLENINLGDKKLRLGRRY